MEDGAISYSGRGSPQGGVLCLLVSNLYLREVLVECEVKSRLRGRAFMVRFADDGLSAFEREDDARRVMEVLPKRLEFFGLTLQPEKTRLVDFHRPSQTGTECGYQRDCSFDLLGFTHYWGRSRKGRLVVQRMTAKSYFSRTLRLIEQWCPIDRHRPVTEQQQALSRKLKGRNAYYGITGNSRALSRFRFDGLRRWYQWLNHSSIATRLDWLAFNRMFNRHLLAPARAVHSLHVT